MRTVGYGYSAASEQGRRHAVRALVAGELFYVLYLPFWWAITDLAFMGFDLSGHGEIGPGLWLFIGYCLAYPPALLLSMAAGWFAFARGRFTVARRWNALPLLWILPIAIYLIIVNSL